MNENLSSKKKKVSLHFCLRLKSREKEKRNNHFNVFLLPFAFRNFWCSFFCDLLNLEKKRKEEKNKNDVFHFVFVFTWWGTERSSAARGAQRTFA